MEEEREKFEIDECNLRELNQSDMVKGGSLEERASEIKVFRLTNSKIIEINLITEEDEDINENKMRQDDEIMKLRE